MATRNAAQKLRRNETERARYAAKRAALPGFKSVDVRASWATVNQRALNGLAEEMAAYQALESKLTGEWAAELAAMDAKDAAEAKETAALEALAAEVVAANPALAVDATGMPMVDAPFTHGELVIRAAEYGVVGKAADVTEAVRARVKNGRVSFKVRNRVLGCDPVPTAAKFLRVFYAVGGGAEQMTVVNERELLQLPEAN